MNCPRAINAGVGPWVNSNCWMPSFGPMPVSVAIHGAPGAEDDQTAQLQKLAALHTQGVLTDAEFAAAKAKVLGI